MKFVKKYISMSKNVEKSLNDKWTQLDTGRFAVLETIISDLRKFFKKVEKQSYCRYCLNSPFDAEPEFCYDNPMGKHEFVVDLEYLKKELIP